MDRSDSTTFRYLRERMAAEAKVIEAAIAPPPPAEQASGEHVEALTKLREREWETADAFGRLDAKWFSRQEAAFDAAIAALSQRPVVDDAVRGLADEYKRWIDFYHGGNGDYDSFLQLELAPHQSEKGEG